jgi:FdhD protein
MTTTSPVIRVVSGKLNEVEDNLAVEEPLQIQILFGNSGEEKTKNIAISMRTPGNDTDLAAGFLFTEGIIKHRTDIIQIIENASASNTVLVILHRDVKPDLQNAERNFYVSSSCGICGKSSIDSVRNNVAIFSTEKNVEVSSTVLQKLGSKLHDEQRAFQSTGGLHACAVFDTDGKLILLREDVGRHNALDKLIGNIFMNGGIPLQDSILLLSGRASFELIQKATAAGIRIIAAIGAPSSLAVEMATEAGITLIGFLKSDRFNIYSGKERIKFL